MSKIVVELDVYVVPDDHKVYKCFPGKTYRFYRAVRDANAVFLDIRGLEALPDDPKAWKDEDALKIISDDRWQRELDSRARGNKPRGAEGVGQTDKRTLTFLKYLLLDAKKGDLIVVPADGYTKDVLIGELGSRLIKSTRRERRSSRLMRDSCAPACRIGLRCA